MTSDFDATTFLSNLSNRFQTLEDLQAELQELSQSLDKELVDLVNDNYQDFLSLGSSLAGGEERIEDVRVGLLSFQRDITSIRDKVEARRNEVMGFLQQKKLLRKDIGVCRAMLEIAERADELEKKLLISRPAQTIDMRTKDDDDHDWSADWKQETSYDSDDVEDDEDGSPITPKLRHRVEQYRVLRFLIQRQDQQHPFVVAQQARLKKIREVLGRDAEEALRQADEDSRRALGRLKASMD